MRYVIAGANSFIGKSLFSTITDHRSEFIKDSFVAVVRSNNDFVKAISKYENVIVKYCEMDKYETIGKIVGKADCFIDLTWLGTRGNDRQDYQLQMYNYQCNLNAMNSMIDSGCKILVSAGSQAEYGCFDGIITEETSCNPNTEYGKAKLLLYQKMEEVSKRNGLRFIEPRYFSLYGPFDYEGTLIMSVLRKLIKNERVDLNECLQIWDYMFVNDASYRLLCLCKDNSATGVFNFATGVHRVLKEYILEMKNTLDSKSVVNFGANKYDGLYINLRPSADKLNSFFPKIKLTSFSEGIRNTVKSLQ